MKRFPEKIRVLFLCTGNSCRSQMAEGWTCSLRGDRIESYSAGVAAKKVDPYAVKAMAEAGIDISNQVSKNISALGNLEFDYVITLCDNARESCPFFPAKTRVLHAGFDDPPIIAANAKNEEEVMAHYRRVRDEIRMFVETLPGALAEER